MREIVYKFFLKIAEISINKIIPEFHVNKKESNNDNKHIAHDRVPLR
jgi:hypothetical protein